MSNRLKIFRETHTFFKTLYPKIQIRNHSKGVVPVKLSYASYENTTAPSEKDPSPLLINHGIIGSKSNWNSICKVYHNKTQRKVIAIDARNHGDSPHSMQHTYKHLVTDIKNFLEEFKMEKISLLGHSMGGRAAMYFALNFPNFVDCLMVVDISPVARATDMKSVYGIFNILQNLTLPKNVSMSVARMQTDVQLGRFVRDKGVRNFLLTNLVQQLDGQYVWRINIPGLVANFRDIASFPSTNNMKFEGPVLFIGGRDSNLIKKSDHTKIIQLFPKAEFQYVQIAGHWLHNEKPTKLLEYTIDFLNKSKNT